MDNTVFNRALELVAEVEKSGYFESENSSALWNTEFTRVLLDKGIVLYNGCYKTCIVANDFDYVIKFESHKNDGSSNKVELENYQRACEEGVSQFFPKTELLFEKYDRTFTLQAKVDKIDEGSIYDAWWDFVKSDLLEYGTIQGDLNSDENVWIINDAVADLTDEERVSILIEDTQKRKELISFIDKHCINDLHEGNWGYINNLPVITDFSGC